MTEFHAGDQIGDYRLEARLGHGGFGTVWRARHVASGRVVALKLLPENDSIQDSASLRADVELLAASAASASPHIVRVLGGGVDPVPHVVMEFVNGTSLAEELKNRGRLTQPEVIDIGIGISEALEALQKVGIVHRDVKPSNVLIDRNGTVKLTDFGIAKIAGYDAVTATGQLPLSIAYAAPEVWEGKAEHRSDLYALGVLLYQCLTGSLPFRGAYAELFYQHRSQAPDLSALPHGTAQSLTDLINVTLRKNPAERPEGAAVCKSLLLQAQQEMNSGVTEEEVFAEPLRFGPWLKGEPHETQPWAWYCKNTETTQDAVVELHFATSADYGESLRAAVAASDRLTPLGAEHLLQTNRMILRPGEAWTDPPPGQFQFWVAREEIALPEPPDSISAPLLTSLVDSIQDLIDGGEEAGVPLHVSASTLRLLPDGSVHLRRPGLDVGYEGNSEQDALAFLRSQSLSRELRPLVSRARTLQDLKTSLDRLEAMAAPSSTGEGTSPVRGNRSRFVLAGIGMSGVVLIVALAIWQFGGGNGGGLNVLAPEPTSTATMTPTAIPNACEQLVFPVTLGMAATTCAPVGATIALDPACPTGTACRRESVSGRLTVYVNDLSVAYVKGQSIARSRENGTEEAILRNAGSTVLSIDWSPDGRYLLYLITVGTGTETITGADAESTQIWIVDVLRSANVAVLLATNDSKDTLDRLIFAPQWSSDSKMIYFLWTSRERPGGDLFAIDVPLTTNGEIDYSRARTGSPAVETYISTDLQSIGLSGSDFGSSNYYFGDMHVAADGHFYLQVCQGTGGNRACGIGHWDGSSASMIVPIEAGIVYGAPQPSPHDGALHAPRFEGGTWNMARLDEGGVLTMTWITLRGSSSAVVPDFTFNRSGDSFIFETAAATLSLVSYNGAVVTPWAEGTLPAWYIAPSAPPATVPPPDSSTYSTPTPSPTPAATATPQALSPMTVGLTVRNAQGAAVSGVRVTAHMNGVECSAVQTNPGSTTFPIPAPNAPAECRIAGSAVTFQIGGETVTGTVPYSPGASLPIDLRMP